MKQRFVDHLEKEQQEQVRSDLNVTEKDRLLLEHLESQFTGDPSLQAAARSNTRENVRLTFEQRAKDQLQDMADPNFQLCKRIADDRAFGKALLDFLFEGFWKGREERSGDRPRTSSLWLWASIKVSWFAFYDQNGMIPEF